MSFDDQLTTNTGTGSSNNYSYLVTDTKTKRAVIIDPANPSEVLPVLKEEEAKGTKLTAIINTHHHHDHAGGNEELLRIYSIPVIGGKSCAKVSKTPAHSSTFAVGDGIKVTALHTPCHTQDSICYFFQDGDEKAVFTGDTLFIGGCGKFFEGTAEEMNRALNTTLASLPDDTRVFPGHEYTKSNVQFAMTVNQDSAVKALHHFAQSNKETTGHFTIGDEKASYKDSEIQAVVDASTGIDTMAKLRTLKDKFKQK